ncbi:LemA family protein [Dehalobacterium formicoaceticum]|uniref:LemA family protein n=1 Tax=Dehalobacterium formicoaceticum TaxID=51515 RepID=A0ABT1Y0A6_9FIRM|nr:LemA family protein [Dehalobacterium formicoaceticum]MCR6544294.1 LemA family protein [Dehalobacterium formicoaceticum]
MMGLIIIGMILVLLAVFLVAIYNNLVQLRQRVQNSWAQVDVQLKRRYDLIPNLVNAVKGYAQHEKSTLETVTQARNMAINAGNLQEQMQAENMLSSALRSLFAVAEAYPELKANTNFLQLQAELSDTESKIAFSRQFYNDTVQKFNTKIELFPNNLVAGMLGFAMVDYFTLQGEPDARQAVKVDF